MLSQGLRYPDLQTYPFRRFLFQVRDELEQLLDDDDDMADLYLSRKLTRASSSSSGSGAPLWFLASPTIGSRISRTSRASAVTIREENDVEELEMLLEVVTVIQISFILLKNMPISKMNLPEYAGLLYADRWHIE